MNPALDIAAAVPRLVADTKLRCSAPTYDPGGGGINVARAIHRLGGDPLALFPAGGPAGESVVRLLEAEGLRIKIVPIRGNTRENFAVTDREAGEQYRFSLPGPVLSAGEVQAIAAEVKASLAGVDFFVISGGLPPGVADNFYAGLIALARKSGVKVILDVTGPALAPALGEGVYLLRLNRTDFFAATGVFPQQPKDVEPFVEDWLAQGAAKVVVITLSARGTVLMTADYCVEIIPPVVKPVSAVGAGDSFVGGMTLALAKDLSLEDAAAYGTAALVSSLQSPGTELCHQGEVEAFFKQMTSRRLRP